MTIYVGFEIEIETSTNTHIHDPLDRLTEETRHITGLKGNIIYDYHQNNKDSLLGKWRLEHDVSLSNGAEFITPPLKIDVALKTLKKFLACVDKCGCTTTGKTGLHINMSSDNMCLDNININNVIPQINYSLLFNLWNSRFENNGYTRSLKSLLKLDKQKIVSIYYNGLCQRKEKLDIINKILLNRRSGFINIRKNTDRKQYFEIRIAGGKDYHKKFENIEQTVEHFKNILSNSQKNVTKSYKSLISYTNRVLRHGKYNKEFKLFIPDLYSLGIPYIAVKKDILLIKKAHSCNIKQLHTEMKQINGKTPFLWKNLDFLDTIITYFRLYITYIYKNSSGTTLKEREKAYNYVIYHYYKYIYNNLGKTECIKSLKQRSHTRLHTESFSNNCFDFSIPKDEPKREVLWLIDCVKELDIVIKKQFVSKLPLCLLNFLLVHKRPGMINITKKAIKELTKNITIPNRELKEKTV